MKEKLADWFTLSLMSLKVTMKKHCNKYYLMDSVLKKWQRRNIDKKNPNNDEYFYKTLEQSGLKKK